jgi:hypothetical protein
MIMVLCHVHTFHLYILLIIRPKRRWIEEVERELKGMGVKDWKRLALKGTTGRRSWRRPRPKLGCGAGGGGRLLIHVNSRDVNMTQLVLQDYTCIL